MSSASHINFCNAAELLVESGNSPRYLYTPGAGTRSESLGEGESISQGDFSNQSTVTSIQTESWSNITGNQPVSESGRVRQSRQEASPTSIDRLALLASVASSSVLGSGSSSQPFAAANMSTYLSGSNAQAEALQTLYLMNPSYTGYGDSSNSGNMVLFSPGTGAVGGHGSPLGSSDPQNQQQHFVRFSLPAVTQSPLSHQSHGASMSNTDLGHQSNSSDFYGSRPGYNWGGGNELSFIPSSHVTEDNQPLAVRVNSVKSGQLSTSDMSHYGVGNLSFHEQAPLFSNSIAAHGLNMENLQAPSGAGQTLSLSLSPQQPSMMQQLQSFPLQHSESAPNFFHVLSNAGSDSNLSKEGMLANKCVGGSVGSSFTVPSCASMLGTGYQSQLNGTESNRQVNMVASHFTMGSYGSKYLKSAQELLNEVVSVGRGIKGNSLKQSKPQSWMGPSSASDGSFAKGMIVGDLPSKSVVSWSGGKEEEPIVTAVPIIGAGISEQMTENAELTSGNRQELQAKRLKLMGMRDEVDRRYKQYYHQMQVIVASFESAAGLGAATTYTALALQTISKHFRCLRDAISGQIQVACKALGEEEVSGLARGETSKLRFIDQQLRQQRALRHLGMMQQQAWRPQRGLPEHSVSILRAWLFEHFLHPYPKDADKILLARQTGLTRNQVSNWFINARVRLWKPMVEEMYLEETKEGDADGADKSGGDEGAISEGVTAGFMDGAANSEMSKPLKQAKLSDENHEAFPEAKHSSNYASDMLQGRNPAGSPSDSLLFHEKESTRQGVMKPKNGIQDTSSFLFPNSSTGIDFKSDRPHGEDVLQHEIKIRTEDSYREPYGIAHNGFVQADHLNPIGYGSFQVSGPNRYSQESFAPSYATNGGVSLTLGLQHCEGLSFSGAQQHYGQGQAHLSTGRREEGGGGSADYYSVNESSYEALGLQNRKPFPTHMLRHDFVV